MAGTAPRRGAGMEARTRLSQFPLRRACTSHFGRQPGTVLQHPFASHALHSYFARARSSVARSFCPSCRSSRSVARRRRVGWPAAGALGTVAAALRISLRRESDRSGDSVWSSPCRWSFRFCEHAENAGEPHGRRRSSAAFRSPIPETAARERIRSFTSPAPLQSDSGDACAFQRALPLAGQLP